MLSCEDLGTEFDIITQTVILKLALFPMSDASKSEAIFCIFSQKSNSGKVEKKLHN